MSQLDQALLNCLAEQRASSACAMSAQSKHPEDVLPGNSVSGSSLETFLLKSFISRTEDRKQLSFFKLRFHHRDTEDCRSLVICQN